MSQAHCYQSFIDAAILSKTVAHSSVGAVAQFRAGANKLGADQDISRALTAWQLGAQNRSWRPNAQDSTAALAVIDTAKSTDHFMTPLGRSRGKCEHGAVDLPRLASPAREGQVLLELGPET
jgi:hypothetical protein